MHFFLNKSHWSPALGYVQAVNPLDTFQRFLANLEYANRYTITESKALRKLISKPTKWLPNMGATQRSVVVNPDLFPPRKLQNPSHNQAGNSVG